jgi:hypothetical protein
MSIWIARSDFIAIAADGSEGRVRVALQAPTPTAHGDWACLVDDDPLVRPPSTGFVGEDSVQALALALTYVHDRLEAFCRSGGRITFDDEPRTDVPLDAQFGRAVAEYLPKELTQTSSQAPIERFFLNVDLDIETEADPSALIQALEPFAYSLERPPGRASFELNTPVAPLTPDPLILEFVRLVKLLPPDAADVWRRAARRTFDLGIQSLRRPFSESHRLAVETLRGAAEVGAEIGFTIYALADDERDDAG